MVTQPDVRLRKWTPKWRAGTLGPVAPLASVGCRKAENWVIPQPLDLFNSVLVFLGSTPGEYRENGLAVPLSDLA